MKTSGHYKLLRFIPALLIMGVIFFFSSQTGDESTAVSDEVIWATAGSDMVGSELVTVIVRKSAHFLEYAALGAMVYFGLRGYGDEKRQGRKVGFSGLFGGLYAVTDELHQYFVPGRACMVRDVLLDTCGAFFGAYAMYLLYRLIGRLVKNNK